MIQDLYQLYLRHQSVQTDTRKLKPNDIFFALSGPNFNGNDFALKALDNGAAYAVIDSDIDAFNDRLIRVENVLETLQLLAKHHREQFNIPFIAITGSNGKTTTKELVNAVLSSHYKTYTTQGNLNNHIGIPLTILQVKADAEVAVIEMGANHQKEIESYCKYVKPTHGIITNCGKAHLEGFGGLKGVRKGKGELFDYLSIQKGEAFIFNDYDYLKEMSSQISKVITYGTSNANTIGRVVSTDDYLQVELVSKDLPVVIKTRLVGDYNLPNVLCAIAVGKYLGVPINKITNAIEGYAPGNSRSQMIIKNSNHIILDAYNANPSSMKLAVENIAKINTENKVLMLGGMMELGAESISEHQEIIKTINKYTWDKVLLVGGDFQNTNHSFLYFNNAAEAATWLNGNPVLDSYVLIKGSRSIQMEQLVASL